VKRINSEALVSANRALGLTGRGAEQTELHDGEVFQTVAANTFARRGLTPAGSEGIFAGVLRNVHAGAGTLTSIFHPYDGDAATAGVAIPPYLAPMPPGFDLWLLTIAAVEASGAGTPTGLLRLDYSLPRLGFGIEDDDSAVLVTPSLPIIAYDALATFGAQVVFVQEDGSPTWRFGPMRLPRAASLRFLWATTATDVATYDLLMTVGVFPSSLGQDAI
jgi:hypothetical protein